MEEKKVSVIVPVYKVEKYLDRCLESIVSQTYNNLEIILVDDGSPDNCPKMCDEWAKKDDRIKVIHKENGGVSSARNEGIKAASGEFIQFIDSDDYIESSFIKNIITKFEKSDVGLVLTGFKVIDDKKNSILREFDEERILNLNETKLDDFINIWADGFITCVVNKIFRKSLINDLFIEGVPLGEDLIFNINYIRSIKNMALIKGSGYIYEFNGASATHKKRDNMFDIQRQSMDTLVLFLDDKFNAHNSQKLYQIFGDVFITCITRSTKQGLPRVISEMKKYPLFLEYKKNYKPVGLGNKLKKFLLKHHMFRTITLISKIKHL